MRADVVVVGSGAGGAAVAGELARAGRRVLVVEAGPARAGAAPGSHVRNFDVTEAALPAYGQVISNEWIYPAFSDTPVEGLPGLAVAHGVGGMFALWCSNSPRPDRSELPSFMSMAHWDRYLDRAEKLMHIDQDVARNGVRSGRLLEATRAAVGALQSGRTVKPMPIAVRKVGGVLKYTASDDLLQPEPGQEAPQILSDYVVQRVLHRGARASGVVAVPRMGGEQVTIHAGTVVIAAGTLATSQIVHASGLDAGPAFGRFLLDHPCLSTRVLLKPEILEDVPVDDPLFSIWVPHSASHPWQNEVFRFPQTPPVGTRDQDGADVTAFVSMDLNPDNRMIFSDREQDPFGLPGVRINLNHSDADHRRIAAATAENYLISAAIADLSTGWAPILYKRGGSAHLAGACRMGESDDGDSVVDATGRLWRYDNVFIAGNAVLGTPSGGNPTFTTVAAALMTADKILGR